MFQKQYRIISEHIEVKKFKFNRQLQKVKNISQQQRRRKNIYIWCHLSGVAFQVSRVTCHVSCVASHMSHGTCHMSLTPTATAMDPPPANSPTMHSRMVCEDPKINFFRGQFQTISELKLKIQGTLFFHTFPLRNLYVIDWFGLGPL